MTNANNRWDNGPPPRRPPKPGPVAMDRGSESGISTGRVVVICTCSGLLGAVLVVMMIRGASRDDDERQSSAETSAGAVDAQTLNFNGRRWTLVGPCKATGDIFRPSMSAVHYTRDQPRVRLLEFVPREGSGVKEGVFARMLFVQALQNGKWRNHGASADWDLESVGGGRGEAEYVNGELHGTQRAWYANGQLKIEREWTHDHMNGVGRGWYRNGNPEYEVVNVNDREVSGQSWHEDGRPR